MSFMRGPQPWLTNRARVLRSNNASAETELWRRLRDRRLAGFKFVRQASIGPYFLDFLCRQSKLVIEVDGATHSTEEEIAADNSRSAELARLGYRVMRVSNRDVYDNIEGVCERKTLAR